MPSTASSFFGFLCSLERPLLNACSSLIASDKQSTTTVVPVRKNKQSEEMLLSFATSPRVQPGMLIRQESFKRSFAYIEPNKGTEIDPALPVLGAGHLERQVSNYKQPKMSTQIPNNDETARTDEKEMKAASLNDDKSRKRAQDLHIMSDDEMQQAVIARRVASFVISEFKGMVEADRMLTSSKVPSIAFEKYVERLIRQFNKWAEESDGPSSIGVSCAVLAVEYLKRANLIMTPYTVHRCFLGAYLVAIKLLYDYYMSNNFWANVGGVSASEVNEIEIAFCQALKWNFGVIPAEHEHEMLFFQADPKILCVAAA